MMRKFRNRRIYGQVDNTETVTDVNSVEYNINNRTAKVITGSDRVINFTGITYISSDVYTGVNVSASSGGIVNIVANEYGFSVRKRGSSLYLS